MRILRLVLMLFVMVALATPDAAQAQGRLGRKLKDKVTESAKQKKEEEERAAARKAANQIDDTVDEAADDAKDAGASVFERRAEKMMANALGEIEEPWELGLIQTGDAHAPFVRYRMVTRVRFPGLDEMGDQFRNLGTVNQEVLTHGGVQRTNMRHSSTVVDTKGARQIGIDHREMVYWITPFDELAAAIDDLSGDVSDVDRDDMRARDVAASDVKLEVIDLKEDKTIRGADSHRHAIVLSSTYASTDSDGGTTEGQMFFVTDTWNSTNVAGYKTIEDYQKAAAEAIGTAFQGQSGIASFLQMMQQNEEIGASLEESLGKVTLIDGFPVETRTYVVQAPLNVDLDLQAVLSGKMASREEMETMEDQVTSQRTVLMAINGVGDLHTETFDLSLLGEPGGDYALTDSPVVNWPQSLGGDDDN